MLEAGEHTYITLASTDEIDGLVICGPIFAASGRVERLDLLNDWIGMLRALYDQELSRGEAEWPQACERDTRGYPGPAEAL